MMKKIVMSMALALVFSGCVESQKSAKKELAIVTATAKEGKIKFKSNNCYDYSNILDGPEDDPQVEVFGYLKIPKNADEKVPAIVFVHGAGGPSKKHKQWLNRLNKMGIATFRLNCFKPRGVISTVGNLTRVTSSMMVVDSYNALKLLSEHQKIDRNRIGIMGGSKGGRTALMAAWEPIREAMMDNELKFALHVCIYPGCVDFEEPEMTGAPILILAGEKDNWTPVQPCFDMSEKLMEAGYDVKVIAYPGAYHSFDADYEVKEIDFAWSYEKCRFCIMKNGETFETTSGLSMSDPKTKTEAFKKCAKRGPKAGQNSKACKQALNDMSVFVTSIFGLE
ncbi:MAG: dienelactone hydrolase family protein [Desulfobacteraceae bacterium]|nr:MAG: dienelactone hydrolase family protein [Desulfobacteraceae bacterium]